MKHALKIATVLLVGVTACAVDPSPQLNDTVASSTISDELPSADQESLGGTTPITQDVTCTLVWECDYICGRFINGVLVHFPTNVLHQECDDGADTVVLKHPCTEDCF